MPYVPLDRFLVRAPLLPWVDGRDAGRRLLRDPLGKLALELGSPSLAAATAGERAARATDRYGRRAAFRATPSGLLAGVAMGQLGARTRAATGQPRAHLDLTWGRVAALGRALLEDPAIRAQARLRRAPSLLRGADRIRWLAFGADGAETRHAELDARLARILDASGAWTSWRALRAAAGGARAGASRGRPDEGGDHDEDGDGDDHDADELLLLLIDDGLLHHDLAPSLIGPPAGDWMTARLAALRPTPPEAVTLAQANAALRAGDLDRARERLRALPRGDGDNDRAATGAAPDVIGTLVHQPARPITLDRTVVERAARLAPLLFRLQEALTPPAAERLADGGARDALETARELFGEGALDAAAWELGDYGVDAGAPPHAGEGDLTDTGRPVSGPPPALVRLLIDEIAGARAEGRDEIALSAPALDRILPPAAAPPTCELFLSPTATRAGWLLGLHAPAGASWGRFAGALGPELAGALAALAAAEKTARPDQRRLDVAYAPSEALADLCAHPPVRDGLLALSTWPAPAATPAPGGDVAIAATLALVTTGGLDGPALTAGAGDRELVPSPLARVRSTTAPPGLFRLLAGFSLYRQHAPWALSLGPLADLAYLPRLSIEGFVIAPASWRIPGGLDARTFRSWRRGAGGAPPPPRFVQVGAADELLPVDLDRREARRDLAGQPRAWEIWPPLPPAPRTSAARAGGRGRGRAVDRDGRRLEAVVALVDSPDEGEADRIAAHRLAIERAGAVPPPRLLPAAPGWQTFALHGLEERQDEVLLDAVLPAVREALAAREIDQWFFLRYADARGRRPHLRLRAHARDEARARADAFAARLEDRLRAARASGAVALVERAEYHPEIARFGGPDALVAALRIFQSDSELACALLAADRAPTDPHDGAERLDLVDRLVAVFDSLAAGLGLDRTGRHRLARQRREAEAALVRGRTADERTAIDADFRARARRLRALLAASRAHDDGLDPLFVTHQAQVAAAVGGLDAAHRARLAAPLLHLTAVRLLGTDRDGEAHAYLFWERTLEGLLRAPAGALP